MESGSVWVGGFWVERSWNARRERADHQRRFTERPWEQRISVTRVRRVEQGGSFFGAVGNLITGAWNIVRSIPGQLLDTAKFLAFDVPAFALYEIGKARGQFGEEVLKELGRNASSNMGSMAVHLQFASEEEQIEARLNMGTLGIYGGGKSLLQGDWKGVGEVAGGWLLPLAPKGLGALGRIGAAVGRGSAVANATHFIGRTASSVARETAGFVGKHGKAAWSQVVHAGQEAGAFANRAWHQFQVGAGAAAREAWGAVQTVAAEIHGRVQQLSETSFNGAWLPKKVAAARVARKVPARTETTRTAAITFRHAQKSGRTTDIAALRAEIGRHVDAWNAIIKKEGIAGLKRRLDQWERFGEQIEAVGRRHTKKLGLAGKDKVWPHYPDMATGGRPKSAVGQPANARLNSIIGGQADRIRETLMQLADDVTEINFDLILL